MAFHTADRRAADDRQQKFAASVRWRAAAMVLLGIVAIALALLAPIEPVYPLLLLPIGTALLFVIPSRAGAGASPALGEDGALPPDAGVVAFADALAEPCIVLDRRALVRHRNGAAARRFPAILAGNPLTLGLRNPELVVALDRSLTGGVTETIELHETVPSEAWHQVTLAPLRFPGRDWQRDDERLLVVTFHNQTELKRVDAMRSDFVANASHELRTPLASLLGFIETLQGPAARDAAAREKFLVIMRGQAERMARLIEDLLSLSRIEMHQHLRPTGEADLSLLLREVREGLDQRARETGLEIVLTSEERAAPVTGDREQLYEVFENLIDNAIKYGADGKTIDVSLERARRPGFAWHVVIADHGRGVAEQHVPRLTERFYRVDAESSRKKKGTGLGLAIVKHIVHRHRGLMTLRSRPGEGLRVELLFPL